ncbi:MAG TPA: DNA (cytosine-5-)-methyltransferase [Micromonosporaceae bacterium]|nr:DNA (cytosine-5-)-methyltransferase [Micromonosporaceae bacterium]
MTATRLRYGSMCSGAGMLDAGVGAVLDMAPAWHAETDPAASTVLAAHWPTVPNLGDIRAVDWSTAPPVDVLVAGFPCQSVSTAGRRRGLADERWLFDDITDAVGAMGTPPRLCVFENVPGLLTANRGHAMARVVHRLAALGYVGRYRLLRASDIGAPHRRERVFILAWPAAHPELDRLRPQPFPVPGRGHPPVADPDGPRRNAVAPLLPTPAARDGDGRGEGHPGHRRARAARTGTNVGGPVLAEVVCHLLPTPHTSDSTPGAQPPAPARSGRGGGPAPPDTATLLPTPRAGDARNGGPNQRGSSDRFGVYAAAVRRWEVVTGRRAPDPTEPGRTGRPRLAARFVEWAMGWPDGWVTDHIPRNDALRACGNGVVPQQAATATADLLTTLPPNLLSLTHHQRPHRKAA